MSGTGLWVAQKAVYTRLTGDATLVALVTGIFDDVPDNQTAPYVVVGDATEVPFRTFEKNGHDNTLTMHVWSVAEGFKQGLAIVDRMTTVLEATPLVIENHGTVSLHEEFTETLREADGVTRHLVVRYRVLMQDA